MRRRVLTCGLAARCRAAPGRADAGPAPPIALTASKCPMTWSTSGPIARASRPRRRRIAKRSPWLATSNTFRVGGGVIPEPRDRSCHEVPANAQMAMLRRGRAISPRLRVSADRGAGRLRIRRLCLGLGADSGVMIQSSGGVERLGAVRNSRRPMAAQPRLRTCPVSHQLERGLRFDQLGGVERLRHRRPTALQYLGHVEPVPGRFTLELHLRRLLPGRGYQ